MTGDLRKRNHSPLPRAVIPQGETMRPFIIAQKNVLLHYKFQFFPLNLKIVKKRPNFKKNPLFYPTIER